MSSPGFEMSLGHQIPVLMKKTQMSGVEGGEQCGLTSLLPMSCRGRAAAFARDLHTRLRNLGSVHHDSDSDWLAGDSARPAPASPRDLDTFYDFELECESPSSPADEFDAPFADRSPTEEPPFYDVDAEPEQSKLKPQEKVRTNGFTFSTAFYTESPVKLQPAPRENGHAEKHIYSPITFEGCARQVSYDETDFAPNGVHHELQERLGSSTQYTNNIDSDSEFESAKSEPLDGPEELLDAKETNEVNDLIDTLSIEENEVAKVETTEEVQSEAVECVPETEQIETNGSLEIVTNEIETSNDKEQSPKPQVDSSLLSAEEKAEQESEEDDRPQRVRRCSSLKTGKTPPGTPGRKKIVRFADVLGLDLADVKTFMDEIPVIPKSAYDDLADADLVQNSPPTRPQQRIGALTLVPLFQVPRDLSEKLEKQNVCLESARVGDGIHLTICGSVRVRNLDFHKTVHIRYTMNRWKTYTDLQATYVPASCDGFSDKFQFVLYAPCITSGDRLEIAVRFQCKGQQFWDNNSGANYCFECLPLGAGVAGVGHPLSPAGPLHPTLDWHPSFY